MTRTAELTTKLLDGMLSEAEGAELDALLASNPIAEAEHLAILELEAELRGLHTQFDISDATVAQVEGVQAEQTADAVLDEITTATPPTWATRPATAVAPVRARGRKWLLYGAAVACAAAVLIGIWLGSRPASSPTPDGELIETAFAKLAHKTGAVEVLNPAGDAIDVEEGGELPPGFTLRTVGEDSLAVIELLRDRTRVEIEPDSVVRFAGDSGEGAGKPRMYLAAGQLTAAVPDRPIDRPLVVGTPVAEVFARGGTFVVSSAGPDSTRVDNKQGKVDLVRAAAPKPVPVIAGKSAFVYPGMDRLDIERSPSVDRIPKRTLAYQGYRDAVFSPDGSEVWVATARAFVRWTANGGLKEAVFYPRKSPEGLAAFSRDKRYLVTYRGERDDRVLVRTMPDGGEHAAINARPAPADPRLWAIAPDAAWLAVIDPRPNNKRVRVFDGRTDEERYVREFDDALTCVAAAPDGKSLAVAVHSAVRGVANKIVVLDAKTSDRLYALSVLKRPVTAMAFSADGRYLAAAYNGTIQLWDMRAGELTRSLTGFERVPTSLAFSPDGKRLAAGTQDGHVWLWSTDTGKQTQLIEVGSRGVRGVAFSPNGKQLVTIANGAPLALWDITDPVLGPETE